MYEFLISHIFQRKRYISIARTGNELGPFSRKRSHIVSPITMAYHAKNGAILKV